MTQLKIALIQMNSVLGDIAGNVKRLRALHHEAAGKGSDLVLAPELCISGYPPEDLVCRPSYVQACMKAARELAGPVRDGPPFLIGLPWADGGNAGPRPYNAAALLRNGEIEKLWFKYDLPNYGIFDDKRVFTGSTREEGEPFVLNGVRIGVAICEDLWSHDKAAVLKRHGVELVLSLNASPYETGKSEIRRNIITSRVRETGLPMAYVNAVGGQDEALFDGGSFIMDSGGAVRARAPSFEEALFMTGWKRENGALTPLAEPFAPPPGPEESDYSALVLGLRDYVRKNGFQGVIIGLSGGVDSALGVTLAVDALGASRVTSVMMPSPYTAPESLNDARELAERLGCKHRVISIAAAMKSVGAALAPEVAGLDTDIMDQNIQSRLRGLFLMALSNATGDLVLAMGNKSEMATGYATLYGDMCGGYAPIKDVYKTVVYRLCRWRNAHHPRIGLGPEGAVIPETILARKPTAELKPDQTDQDTLPPYDALDAILQGLVEQELSIEAIVRQGHDEATVRKVLRILRMSEYKRKQAAPGTKITTRAFGRDRRYPITSRSID